MITHLVDLKKQNTRKQQGKLRINPNYTAESSKGLETGSTWHLKNRKWGNRKLKWGLDVNSFPVPTEFWLERRIHCLLNDIWICFSKESHQTKKKSSKETNMRASQWTCLPKWPSIKAQNRQVPPRHWELFITRIIRYSKMDASNTEARDKQ